jgi:hypothetical protein
MNPWAADHPSLVVLGEMFIRDNAQLPSVSAPDLTQPMRTARYQCAQGYLPKIRGSAVSLICAPVSITVR